MGTATRPPGLSGAYFNAVLQTSNGDYVAIGETYVVGGN
jgi:hypothetical protein